MSVEALPDFVLDGRFEIARPFLEREIETFHEAAYLVRDLPYGRNSDRSNWRLVLEEGRGTCSTKHALLAELAKAHGRPVKLRIGIYEMSEANTPGVGAVLEKHGFDSIPEAHCYLAHLGERVDLTTDEAVRIASFLHEEEIEAGQIGEYKVAMHKEFAREWAEDIGVPYEFAWRVREKCIAALSE